MNDSIVEIRNIIKNYGSFKALNDVSLELRQGEIVGLLGHNGAGKSTLIKCIMGVINSYQGDIKINGINLKNSRKNLIKKCGFLLEPAFLDYLTAKENLKLLAIASHKSNSDINRVLELVSLKNAANKKVGDFSFGMKQRLGLAQALLNEPEILILDEPTVGLDPMGVKLLKDSLVYMAEKGSTIMFSSHQLKDVQDICSRIIVLNNGSKIHDGDLKEILSKREILIITDQEKEKLTEILVSICDSSIIIENSTIRLTNIKDLNKVIYLLVSSCVTICDINIYQNALADMITNQKGDE